MTHEQTSAFENFIGNLDLDDPLGLQNKPLSELLKYLEEEDQRYFEAHAVSIRVIGAVFSKPGFEEVDGTNSYLESLPENQKEFAEQKANEFIQFINSKLAVRSFFLSHGIQKDEIDLTWKNTPKRTSRSCDYLGKEAVLNKLSKVVKITVKEKLALAQASFRDLDGDTMSLADNDVAGLDFLENVFLPLYEQDYIYTLREKPDPPESSDNITKIFESHKHDSCLGYPGALLTSFFYRNSVESYLEGK